MDPFFHPEPAVFFCIRKIKQLMGNSERQLVAAVGIYN